MGGVRSRTREKLRWMAIGTAYAWLFPFGFMVFLFGRPVLDSMASATVSAVVGGPVLSGFFLFLVPATRRFAFFVAMAIQLAAFVLIMFPVFFLGILVPYAISERVALWDATLVRETLEIMASPQLRTAYLYTLVAIPCVSAVYQVSRKLGPGVLWSWLTGRYHRPREEELIFMFLDMKHSTALAERLGNLRFSSLMQEFFVDVSEPLGCTKGRVSHYIGDEAVIYWKPAEGLRKANCVRCVQLLEATIAERRGFYLARFGAVPEFKAGLHIGHVVAAEVGDRKSEIVFHGDVLNTTARIVGLCSSLDCDLLLSKFLAERLTEAPPDVSIQSVGEHELKGKLEPVELFSATFERSAPERASQA